MRRALRDAPDMGVAAWESRGTMSYPVKRQRFMGPTGSPPEHPPSSSAPASWAGADVHGLGHLPEMPGASLPRPVGAATAALHRRATQSPLPGPQDLLAEFPLRTSPPPPGVMTPDGVHVSLLGRREIQRLHDQGTAPASIADRLKLTANDVERIIDQHADMKRRHRDIDVPPPGSKTPLGRHLSKVGREAIRALKKDKPHLSLSAIGRTFKVGPDAVAATLRAPKAGETLPGMRTPGGSRVSDEGKAMILQMHRASRPNKQSTIAARTGLTEQEVRKVIVEAGGVSAGSGGVDAQALHHSLEALLRTGKGTKRRQAGGTTPRGLEQAVADEARLGGPPGQAPARPTVALPDWPAVAARAWNAGDRISVSVRGVPAFFEVTRNRQKDDELFREDFRPLIRGG